MHQTDLLKHYTTDFDLLNTTPPLPSASSILGQNPRCQSPALIRGPILHLEKPGENRSHSRNLQRGFSRTAQTHCPTAQSRSAFSFWTAGHCQNPHPTPVYPTSEGCPPRCQTCSGCHLSRSQMRRVCWAFRHRQNRCCYSWDVWRREVWVRH